VVREVAINVGFRFTDSLQVSLGCTYLACNDVVRPGDQIDRVLNKSQLPTTSGPSPLVGPARPAFLFKGTDFWVQGVNCGMEYRY